MTGWILVSIECIDRRIVCDTPREATFNAINSSRSFSMERVGETYSTPSPKNLVFVKLCYSRHKR